MANREQQLIDIMFSVALTVQKDPWFVDKSQEEVATWLRQQLQKCGFDTEPCGSSWGVLKNK